MKWMRYIAFCGITAFLTTSTITAATGLVFHEGSWDEVRSVAQELDKPIFVKVFAEYCAPCKLMEDYVFTDKSVSNVFSEEFVNYTVDLESFEGSLFQLAYNVKSIPDLLIFSPEGQIVSREKGAMTRDELLGFAQRAMTKIELGNVRSEASLVANEEAGEKLLEDGEESSTASTTDNTRPAKTVKMSLYEMDKMYDSGYSKAIFLFDYAYELKAANRPTSEVSAAFIETENWKKKSTWNQRNVRFLFDFVQSVEHPAFDLIIGNMRSMNQSYDRASLAAVLENAIHQSIGIAAVNGDKKMLKRSLAGIQKARLKNGRMIESTCKVKFYEQSRNWKNYAKELDGQIKSGHVNTATDLNLYASVLCENQNKKKLLKTALEWVNRSIEMEAQQYNLLTKAEILMKLDSLEAALSAAEEAKNVASIEEAKEVSSLINKIKNLQ